MERLGWEPYQGMLRPLLGVQIRNATKGRAVFYYETNATCRQVRIFAVFFGGQDHKGRILLRRRSRP